MLLPTLRRALLALRDGALLLYVGVFMMLDFHAAAVAVVLIALFFCALPRNDC